MTSKQIRRPTTRPSSIERTYDAPPERVFARLGRASRPSAAGSARPAVDGEHQLDFRVGGREHQPRRPARRRRLHLRRALPRHRRRTSASSTPTTCTCDDTRISVSVATVEFEPAGAGARLLFTEQGVFLDGRDTPGPARARHRELLDRLG